MKVPDNKVTCKPGTSYGSFLGPGLYSKEGCELIYVPNWLLFNKTETVCPHGNRSLLLFRKVRDVIPASLAIEAAMQIDQQHEQQSLAFFYVTLASAPGFLFSRTLPATESPTVSLGPFLQKSLLVTIHILSSFSE